MIPYEFLGIVIGLISATIALTALVRGRVVAAKQLELQAITAALASGSVRRSNGRSVPRTRPTLPPILLRLAARSGAWSSRTPHRMPEVAEPALVNLVEFSLFTGLRKSEALGLNWERVDRSRGVVRLEHQERKAPGGASERQCRRRARPPLERWRNRLRVRDSELERFQDGVGDSPTLHRAGRFPLPRPSPHVRLVARPAEALTA